MILVANNVWWCYEHEDIVDFLDISSDESICLICGSTNISAVNLYAEELL